MNRQFETAWQLHAFLSTRGIPYAIIGGIAVQRWGRPRLTRDVDLTVLLPPGGEEATLREIVAAFPARIEDAVAFALEHRVLPVDVPGGSEADLSLGLPGYEEHLIARTVAYDLGDGREVRLCSAEDLIIHKALAGRPQDVLDIEGVVARHGAALDIVYVHQWLEELARLADDPEVVARFERIWAERADRGHT
ncbi:MAG: hypothetical protein ACE5JN_01120 [Candidatus Methylomirabilia bacterium]